MAMLAIVFEDQDGSVKISVEVQGQLPTHPRGFTNAQEVCDGVLKLIRVAGPKDAQIETLSELLHRREREKLKLN
jgi:hypothetical protein